MDEVSRIVYTGHCSSLASLGEGHFIPLLLEWFIHLIPNYKDLI